MPGAIQIKVRRNTITRVLERVSQRFREWDPVDLAYAIRDTTKMNIVQSNIGYPSRIHQRGLLLKSAHVVRHGRHSAEVAVGGPTTTFDGWDYAVIQERGRGPIEAAKGKRLVFRGLEGGLVFADRVRGAKGKFFFENAVAKEAGGYATGLGEKRVKAIIDSGGRDDGLRVGMAKAVL
jgi:hypothetical protein